MSNVEAEQVFELFTRDHPNFKGRGRWADMPDGTREFVFTTEAMEAFVRWCLVNGLGDRDKVVDFLTKGIPELKAQLAEAFKTGDAAA